MLARFACSAVLPDNVVIGKLRLQQVVAQLVGGPGPAQLGWTLFFLNGSLEEKGLKKLERNLYIS